MPYAASQDETEPLQVTTSKVVLARTARRDIRPGDLVCVTTGFEYEKGGPRMGYFRSERVVGYGPGHGPARMGLGDWRSRGGFRAVHPAYADMVEARMALRTLAEQAHTRGFDLEAWERQADDFESKYGTWEAVGRNSWEAVGRNAQLSTREGVRAACMQAREYRRRAEEQEAAIAHARRLDVQIPSLRQIEDRLVLEGVYERHPCADRLLESGGSTLDFFTGYQNEALAVLDKMRAAGAISEKDCHAYGWYISRMIH